MEYIFTLLGLAILIISGNYLIVGASQMARYFKLSSLVIGATVIAFGTSAPELIVSVNAVLSSHPDIAIGNVVGSNIANVALVLAVTAILIPIPVKSKFILRDWFFMILSFILFIVFILDDSIVFYEGAILFTLLLYFIYRSIVDPRKKGVVENVEAPSMKLWISIVLIIISSIGLAWGADILVDGASQIARNLGVSEKVISVSLIAFGTSVPELTASIIAAIKKETDISIGNIIGSNIFNVFAVIGVSSMIKTISIEDFFKQYLLDSSVMVFIGIILLLLISPVRNGLLSRWKGLTLLSVYIAYVCLLFTA